MLYVNEDVVLTFEDGTKVKRSWLGEENGQAILAKRTHLAVLCRCTSAGVPMHVVTRGTTHHISSNPNYAHCHALSCPSYVEEATTTRLSLYADAAIKRFNHRQHVVVENEPSHTRPMSHMTPSALLDYLWELSGLTVCTPKTVRSRTNFLVSESLRGASEFLTINGSPLVAHIPMTRNRPGFTDGNWVIGQISKAKRGKYDNRITLTGERTPLWVSQSAWNQAGLSSYLGEYNQPILDKHLWLIGKLTQTASSNYHVHSIGLREMNAYFLPCYEHVLNISDMIENNQSFKVCPRFDSLSTDFPDALLFEEDAPKHLFFD
ncbi:MAG: DUF1173 family protein [Pseudomonadales bacterium]|nr:DUF1173 family protein [Pseudomonadales bacterium]